MRSQNGQHVVPRKAIRTNIRGIMPSSRRSTQAALLTCGARGENRAHELLPPDADLPTAPASDVPTPSTFAEAESSEHAALWRDSRTREFRGLLQADTFGPA